jgi:hypothetical protein
VITLICQSKTSLWMSDYRGKQWGQHDIMRCPIITQSSLAIRSMAMDRARQAFLADESPKPIIFSWWINDRPKHDNWRDPELERRTFPGRNFWVWAASKIPAICAKEIGESTF